MWPYLIGVAAAGVALGRRRHLEKKAEEAQILKRKTEEAAQILKLKTEEAATKLDASRQIISLISNRCWQKSIEKGLIPEYDSPLSWELFKYEYIPKDKDNALNKVHVSEAIRKEICRAIKGIDAKYDAEHRAPAVAQLGALLRQRLKEHPNGISAICEELSEEMGTLYTQRQALYFCQELLADSVAQTMLFGGSVEGVQQDKIFRVKLAEIVKLEIDLYDKRLISELKSFVKRSYNTNCGVYESIIIETKYKSNRDTISQLEASKLLLSSKEFWNDLLETCDSWRFHSRSGVLERMGWNDSLKTQIINVISQALDAESELAQESATELFLEIYRIRLSKEYAWNLHNAKKNPREILLAQIRDLLNRREFDECLSHNHAIRLAWDASLANKLSYKICERILRAYSIAYAEEEKLSHTLSGIEYEKLCGKILSEIGWSVKFTKGSNDQGVDLLATRDSIILCIQCKRHKSPVGNDAVQAIFAGKTFYSATHACVVTTSGYTKAAKELAASTDVTLLRTKDLYSIHKKISTQTSASIY